MSTSEIESSREIAVRQWLTDSIDRRCPELEPATRLALAEQLWFDANGMGEPLVHEIIAHVLRIWHAAHDKATGGAANEPSMLAMMYSMDATAFKSIVEFRLGAIQSYGIYLQELQGGESNGSAVPDQPSHNEARIKAAKEKAVAAMFGDEAADSALPYEAVLKVFQMSERWHRLATAYGEGMVWLVSTGEGFSSPGIQPELADEHFDIWCELVGRRWPTARETEEATHQTLKGFLKDEAPPPMSEDQAPGDESLRVVVEGPSAHSESTTIAVDGPTPFGKPAGTER